MLRPLAPALFSALALAGCQAGEQQPALSVTDARISLPAVKGRPGAAYFAVQAATATRLTGLSSPRVQRIELHESMAAGMGSIKDARLPAGGRLEFAPGGRHAMLFGIDPKLAVGDRVALTFEFEGVPAVTVQASVMGPGGGRVAH